MGPTQEQTRLPHGGEDNQEGLCQGLDKKHSENQENKREIFQAIRVELAKPWRRDQKRQRGGNTRKAEPNVTLAV